LGPVHAPRVAGRRRERARANERARRREGIRDNLNTIATRGCPGRSPAYPVWQNRRKRRRRRRRRKVYSKRRRRGKVYSKLTQ